MNEKQEELKGEVMEDTRTGEIIPKGSPPELRPGILAQVNINQVGTLEVDVKALAVLEEPLDPNDVQIREDGLIYLPWTWYNKKLNRAFGYLQWGQIPQGAPQVKDMGKSVLVVWLHWLVIRGIPVSMAAGETSYRPSNQTMSYGDAVEGARSNSLARNCKNLGMALELWDKAWVDEWKVKFAEKVKNPKSDYPEYIWRKKGSKSPENPSTGATTPQNTTPAAKNSTEQEKTTETTSTHEKTAPSVKTYTGTQVLENLTLVQYIIEQSQKTSQAVCGLLGRLEKGKKFSVEEILNMLKEA